MKRKTYTLYLSCEEYGVILDALIRFKNKLTRQGRYTDIVDEVIPVSYTHLTLPTILRV